MADRVVVTKSLTAAVVNAIAATQALAAAGNLTINGTLTSSGVATLDSQRRISILSSGNDSGLTWTIYGANGAGAAIQENVPGGNGVAVVTQQDFATVNRVAGSGATAGTVQVGTNTVGSTEWQIPNPHIVGFELGFAAEILSGAATYSIELTDDTLLAPMPIYSVAPLPLPNVYTAPGLGNQMGAVQGAVTAHAPAGWRLTVTSGTGNTQATATQAGIRN